VVANLLENAIKYTEPGGQISISLVEEGAEGVLRVADNGIGIAAENVGRIFDLFTQVDSARTRAAGGLGLGLNVVRRVLELHGGRIEVRSGGLGQGSEFTARLPLISTTLLRTKAGRALPEAAANDNPRRILIVDDNADSAAAMSLLFRHWGHEVKSAQSGVTALKLLEEFGPDVAFIDIGLPDIDGYEVARRLRALPARRPVQLIALTGFGTAVDRERSKDAGFDEHVVKPANAEQLARLLNAA